MSESKFYVAQGQNIINKLLIIVNDFYSPGNPRVSVRRLGDTVWKEDQWRKISKYLFCTGKSVDNNQYNIIVYHIIKSYLFEKLGNMMYACMV